jgi:hypothetical protein
MVEHFFNYEGRIARNCGEMILFHLAKNPQLLFTSKDLTKSFKLMKADEEITQIKSFLYNFNYMRLIERIDNTRKYRVNHARLDKYIKAYLAGKVRIWIDRKKDSIGSIPAGHLPTLGVIAIFAAYKKPLTIRDVVQIADHYSIALSAGTVQNYVMDNPEVIKDPLPAGKAYRYSAAGLLYKQNAININRFIELLPHRKRQLLENFNSYAADIIKLFLDGPCAQQEAGQNEGPCQQQETAAELKAASGAEVVSSIFAAYNPMKLTDIVEKSRAIGRKVNYPLATNFRYRYARFIERIPNPDGAGLLFRAKPEFYIKLAPQFLGICQILPDQKVMLATKFKEHVPDIDQFLATGPKVIPINFSPPGTADRPEQSPPPEKIQQTAEDQSLSNLEDDQAPAPSGLNDEANLMDAVTVGSAIINYINRLKYDLKNLKAAQPEESFEDLKTRIENLTASVINLKAESGNYQFQVKKLEKIIEEKDRRIDMKTKQIEDLQRKLDLKNGALPTSFKMGEVARVTRIIKGDRRR